MTTETALAPAGRQAIVANGSALGIQRRMVQLGKLRMGDKGSKGEPRKLSKWRMTSASRQLLEAAARLYGGTVRAWQGAPDEGMWELLTTSEAIDVMVPPTMNAYSQFYEDWSGGTCNVRCDGRWDSIAEKACDHDHVDGTAPSGLPWRVTTRVSVILPKLPGLGIWGLETHGWNAASTLPATLDLIGATRAWIPAVIRLEQRSSRKRDEKTNRVLVQRFVVPVLDLAGASFEQLLAGGADDTFGMPSDSIGVPALGAGPGSLALPPGPARPTSTRVPRPPMADEPPLDDETAAFGGPIERPFPDEAPAFDPVPEPAAADPDFMNDVAAASVMGAVPFAASLRAAALEGDDAEVLATDEDKVPLRAVFEHLRGRIGPGIGVLWPGQGPNSLSKGQARALEHVHDSIGPEAFVREWNALVEGAGVPA